jgi:predicted Zn-dependent protease
MDTVDMAVINQISSAPPIMISPWSHLEEQFARIASAIASACAASAQFTLTLLAEDSQFVRFNHAKVRQTGFVQDAMARLTLMQAGRSAYWEFPITGTDLDQEMAMTALQQLQQDLPQLPINPYLVIPTGGAKSHETHIGQLLSPDSVPGIILALVADLDFAGIYSAGQLLRGYADSAGQRHWFATDNYSLDYSIFTAQGQALKGTIAGKVWDCAQYQRQIQEARLQLKQLSIAPKKLPRGQYRTYFAPAAVAEITSMLSWGGVSESSYRQGGSCFAPMRRGGRRLSEKLSFGENFAQSAVPRFNELGEVAPPKVPIVTAGELTQLLVSSATAKEHNLTANGANGDETLRALEIAPGTIPTNNVLSSLGTGLYVGNLHYLNWSDRPTGRITGMTRYACFWVEDGQIVAPIEHLRFDESLYRFWGENLVGFTDQQALVPEVGTYGHRAIGGVLTPGMIVDRFTYTL